MEGRPRAQAVQRKVRQGRRALRNKESDAEGPRAPGGEGAPIPRTRTRQNGRRGEIFRKNSYKKRSTEDSYLRKGGIAEARLKAFCRRLKRSIEGAETYRRECLRKTVVKSKGAPLGGRCSIGEDTGERGIRTMEENSYRDPRKHPGFRGSDAQKRRKKGPEGGNRTARILGDSKKKRGLRKKDGQKKGEGSNMYHLLITTKGPLQSDFAPPS